MKKIVALVLALTLCATLLAGFAMAETNADLADARDYVVGIYEGKPTATPVDYTVIGRVYFPATGLTFNIDWTVDNEAVKLVKAEDGKTWTVDVDDRNPKEVTYTLTATLKDENGNTESASFTHTVPAALILTTRQDVLNAGYALESGASLPIQTALTGVITKIDTPYSEQYGNISIIMEVDGNTEQPIMAYRLKGEGADKLAVGDTICVMGTLKNYKGTIEFDAGCVLMPVDTDSSIRALLDAYTLEEGAAAVAASTITGVITKIDSAYSEKYGNISVIIEVAGLTDYPFMCYRLAGEGAETLAVGDTITATGTAKNYKGTIEFDAGCQLIPYGTAAQVRTLLNAYTLEDGMAMDKSATLTGVIVKIPTAYSPDYQNITVDMVVAGMADHVIQCYRLAGEGAEGLAIGDTITVTGIIKNYKGTIEFDKGCTLDAVVKAE